MPGSNEYSMHPGLREDLDTSRVQEGVYNVMTSNPVRPAAPGAVVAPKQPVVKSNETSVKASKKDIRRFNKLMSSEAGAQLIAAARQGNAPVANTETPVQPVAPVAEQPAAQTPPAEKPALVSKTVAAEQPIDGYSMKSFYDSKLLEKYGTDASRRDVRRFNRYMRSDQGAVDKRRFDEIERKKQEAYINAQIEKGLRARSAAPAAPAAPAKEPAPVAPAANPVVTTPVNPKVVTPRSDAYWNDLAVKNGFKDMAHVKAWQAANGLVDDGKFGNKSRAFFEQNGWGKYEVPGGEIDAVEVVAEKKAPQYYYTSDSGRRYSYADNKLTELTADQTKGWEHKGSIKDMTDFRKAVDFNSKTVNFGGIRWDNPYYLNNAFRTTNNAPDWNKSGKGEGAVVRVKGKEGVFPLRVWNDRSFAIDAANGVAYEMKEDWLGEVDGRGNDAPLRTVDLYSFFNFSPEDQARLKSQKQGGIMERINYFQQGGAAAPKQDMKAQVVALVQAAMQGDQKATQQVNQIMEAAKAGDQQAMQIAQLMEQVVKELQGQATSAKWGSKLGYIKSLKYAKGGKTCPACEKKVEMKACGGKKAKKRYFGGLV